MPTVSETCRGENCNRLPVVMSGLCRRCYTRKINGRVLDRIEAEFKPLTENNKFIFEKYLESTRARLVSDADVVLARKFSLYLSLHSVEQLTSWSRILEISKLMNLRYVQRATTGCPIKQIGRWLEQAGEIAPLEFEKNIDRSTQVKFLREPLQSWARKYFDHLLETHRAVLGLRAINAIKSWDDFLQPRSILEGTEECAKEFIASLPETMFSRKIYLLTNLSNFYQWLMSQAYVESNPFCAIKRPSVVRSCSKCGKERVFYHLREQCERCTTDQAICKKLKTLEDKSNDLSEYGQNIFKLHLRYLRRYYLTVDHLRESKEFFAFLKYKNNLAALKTWPEVQELSLEFREFTAVALGKGCPVFKTANVLQELGVLAIREESYDLGIDEKLNSLSTNLRFILERYVVQLRQAKRHEKTLHSMVSRIKHFHDWLMRNDHADFWSPSEPMARNYLLACGKDIGSTRNGLRQFYEWAKVEKYTLSNPFETIGAPKPKASLKVCSPEQTKIIEKFIRSPKADVESAMILALIFYWGIKIKELAYASVEFEDDQMRIIFHRLPLTFQSNRYLRDQVLTLPRYPSWLAKLQKNFKFTWQAKFKNICADLPRQPLILDPLSKHNRPLHTLTVRKIYYQAIQKACGVRIPANVLRRAGADLIASQGGSGALQNLGWARATAFKFTWMPREFFCS